MERLHAGRSVGDAAYDDPRDVAKREAVELNLHPRFINDPKV